MAKKMTAKKTVKKTVKKAAKKTGKKVAGKKQSAGVVKTPTLVPGDLAPDFTLLDQNGKEVSLHDFRGMYVVVYFYPKAMTPGCTAQACGIRDSEAKLRNEDVVVLAISADPVKSLKKFEEKEDLNFTLLSDPEKKTIEAYGAWGPKKFMGREFMGILRQTFFIGKDGKILHIMHKVETKNHHQEILALAKSLRQS